MISILCAPTRPAAVASALSLIVLSAACAGTSPAPSTSVAAPKSSAPTAATSSAGPKRITEPYAPTIDPSAFSTTIDNPYFPLTPGTRTIYEATSPDGVQLHDH